MNGLRGSNLDKALVAVAIKVRETYVASISMCEDGRLGVLIPYSTDASAQLVRRCRMLAGASPSASRAEKGTGAAADAPGCRPRHNMAMTHDATHPQEAAKPRGASSTRRRVFVSYRRQDSQGTTGRLSDGLEHAFGKDTMFRDGRCDPSWNELRLRDRGGADGKRRRGRRDRPELAAPLADFRELAERWSVDYLRWELKTALARRIFTVPVLVDGASMPAEKDLPDELKALAILQAQDLSDKDWEYDLGRLVELIRPRLRLPVQLVEAPKMPASRWIVGSGLIALLALVAAGVFCSGDSAAPAGIIDVKLPRSLEDFLADHSADGGAVLLIGSLLLVLANGLLAKYNDALGGRFGDLLKDGHAFAVTTVGLLVAAMMFSVGRSALRGRDPRRRCGRYCDAAMGAPVGRDAASDGCGYGYRSRRPRRHPVGRHRNRPPTRS
jgi:hypothetical protein